MFNFFRKKNQAESVIPVITPAIQELSDSALALGSSPAAVDFLLHQYLSHKITENEFEDLLENSIYIVDLNYLKEKFLISEKPEEMPKRYVYPAATIGACFGDISGSAYEFETRASVRKELNYGNCLIPSSIYTDDSILTCATAYAIKNLSVQTSNRKLELADFTKENLFPYVVNPFIDAYLKFTNDYPNASYGGAFFSWALANEKHPYGSYGNGSAMRVAPVADSFSDPNDIIFYATASAAATHNHYEGIKGAIVTAMATHMAYQGYSKEQIFQYIIKFYPTDLMRNYLKSNIVLSQFTLAELKLKYGPTICQYAVPAAAVCFFYSNSYEDVITNCLSFVGDTDTIAAIAGAVAGAYYGVPEKAQEYVKGKFPKDLYSYIEKLQKEK